MNFFYPYSIIFNPPAKFQTNSRILKKYTAIYENRPPAHAEGRNPTKNFFNFCQKSDKLFHETAVEQQRVYLNNSFLRNN